MEINGTTYHDETDPLCVQALEIARMERTRIRVWLMFDGKVSDDEHDVIGYVGRSTGTSKIPLLVYNRRSYGGGALLDHCIGRVQYVHGGVMWQSPDFVMPEYTIKDFSGLTVKGEYGTTVKLGYGSSVLRDGQTVANFNTHEQAQRWTDFMTGKRMSK